MSHHAICCQISHKERHNSTMHSWNQATHDEQHITQMPHMLDMLYVTKYHACHAMLCMLCHNISDVLCLTCHAMPWMLCYAMPCHYRQYQMYMLYAIVTPKQL